MQASSIMRWGESLTLAGTCQIDSCPKSLNTARKRAEDGMQVTGLSDLHLLILGLLGPPYEKYYELSNTAKKRAEGWMPVTGLSRLDPALPWLPGPPYEKFYGISQ